jgi:hypothetical protein
MELSRCIVQQAGRVGGHRRAGPLRGLFERHRRRELPGELSRFLVQKTGRLGGHRRASTLRGLFERLRRRE